MENKTMEEEKPERSIFLRKLPISLGVFGFVLGMFNSGYLDMGTFVNVFINPFAFFGHEYVLENLVERVPDYFSIFRFVTAAFGGVGFYWIGLMFSVKSVKLKLLVFLPFVLVGYGLYLYFVLSHFAI